MAMPKQYRKKPVVVEAVRWKGEEQYGESVVQQVLRSQESHGEE